MRKKLTILFIFIYLFFGYASNTQIEAHQDLNHKEHSHEHGHESDHEHDDDHEHDHEHNHEHEHDHEHEHEHEHNHNHEEEHEHDHHHHDHEHGHENLIKLTEEQRKASGITVSTASNGVLSKNISLNGEIQINTLNQTHQVAKAAGICHKINCVLGDKVEKGQVLAVLDSAVLGQAKSEYYEVFNLLAISKMNLERARTLNKNVTSLLQKLAILPENIDFFQKENSSDMGEYRAKLLSAYTEFINNKKNMSRKNKLFKDKIISENDYLNAKSSFDKASAEYFSIQDSTSFEIKQKLFEAEQTQKINEFRKNTAEQNLRILGLSTDDIEKLNISGAIYQKECTNDHCDDIGKGKHFHNDPSTFSQIEIKAERTGTLIAANIELGESVENNKIIFTIADLNNVWAVLQASTKDVSSIKKGQSVVIISEDGVKTIGKVVMVSPLINEETRTATVRVLIDNQDNRFRPGSFVNGEINISAKNLPVVISKEAVQNINGSNVVFVDSESGFKPVDVTIGREDSEKIEIIKGLKAGTKYVSSGAFTLKAIVVTSGIDPHAGHGH